jgi:hypothetical protein
MSLNTSVLGEWKSFPVYAPQRLKLFVSVLKLSVTVAEVSLLMLILVTSSSSSLSLCYRLLAYCSCHPFTFHLDR